MSSALSKWAIVGDVIVTVTGPGIIPDDRFQYFLQDLRKDPVKKYFGAALGRPESTSLQRKQTSDILKGRGIRSVVITDDAMTLGIVTALSWLGVDVKAFSWKEAKSGLQFLDVEEPLSTLALDTLGRLRREVEAGSR